LICKYYGQVDYVERLEKDVDTAGRKEENPYKVDYVERLEKDVEAAGKKKKTQVR